MTDYVLTKHIDPRTGQLSDRVTIVLTTSAAWLVVKQIEIQLEQCAPVVTIEIYGKVETK